MLYDVQMSALKDGLLEKGEWEDISTESKFSAPAHAAKWAIDLVRPTFATKTSARPKQLRRTAYLDGLRGFAAFIVYWHHHQLWAREAISLGGVFENAYGYDKQYYLATLPWVRTFFTGGHFAVTIFFVLSGYVLSAKPLQLIQAGEHAKLADNVTSALFRRWLRLNIPLIGTTFCYFTMWHLFGIRAVPDAKSSYREELWNWYMEFKNFTFIFNQGGDPWFVYNFHSWSIPVEFRGSIVVYTAVLALSKCRKNARLLCEVVLLWYFMYVVDGWFCALFMSGMILCDLDHLSDTKNLPVFFSYFEPVSQGFFYALFIIAVYLGGVPSHNSDINVLRKSPGWYHLSLLKPQAVFDYKWFYLFWAATFLVASVQRIHWLKTFFETRFCQYLGRISFSLYLVHGPVLWTLGDRLYAAVGWPKEIHATTLPGWINRFPLSKAGPLGLELSFLLPHLILLPLTLWLAELATKLFDEPSLKFSQWLYQVTKEPPSEKD